MFGWWQRWRARSRLQTEVEAGAEEPEPEEPEPEIDDETAPSLTDELDLHTFQPRDCKDLVDEYLRAAQEAGFVSVRIIHGKGKGTLRRIVHSVCEQHVAVRAFRLADQRSGSWGATLVDLHPVTGQEPKARG